MILRRFMKHITDQNWFAVGLDVIVVIVGIFLGLQVQAWYEDRADRTEERVYLNRLHLEIEELSGPVNEYYNERLKVLANLKSASDVLQNKESNLTMTQAHCAALAVSHVYTNRFVQLPSLNELLSSGKLGILKNEVLRNLISRYTLRLQSTTSLLANLQSDQLDISRDYPEIIKLDSYMINSGVDGQSTTCNFDLMKTNISFNNALVGNTSRYIFFVRYLTDQQELLSELHNAIDVEIGVTH